MGGKYSMITRLLFIGENRVNDSILTLLHDRFLCPVPDQTLIYCSDRLDIESIKSLYSERKIDIQNFKFFYDKELLSNHPYGSIVNNFSDPSGVWIDWYIKQQLYKFLALDLCNTEYVLIQDCDTFCIKPYRYFINGEPSVFGSTSEKITMPIPMSLEYDDILRKQAGGHGSHWNYTNDHYRYFNYLTGSTEVYQGIWISEFMPIKKTQWIDLKTQIESNCKLPWMESLFASFIYGHHNGWKLHNFVEYTVLAQWLLTYENTTTITQLRAGLDGDMWNHVKNRSMSLNFQTSHSYKDISYFDVMCISRHQPFTLEDIDYIYSQLQLRL